jgi:Holliday junction resolvase RusA-like endonuclease
MATLFQHAIDDQRFALVVLQMLTRATSPQPAVCVVHEGIPVPKGRPRFTKDGGAFTPARTKTAEQDLAWTLKAHVRQRPMVGPLAMVAMFYVPDQRRADADNFLKLLKDAGNVAGIWHDDSQVVACAVTVSLDAARPRTVVALAPAVSELKRMPSKKSKRAKNSRANVSAQER